MTRTLKRIDGKHVECPRELRGTWWSRLVRANLRMQIKPRRNCAVAREPYTVSNEQACREGQWSPKNTSPRKNTSR